MIEIGRAEMKKDGTGVLNGMLVRTEKKGGEVFFVHVTNGDEMVLNVTQILKDLGWAPAAATYEAGAAAERAACADLCDAIGRAGTMLSGADAHAHHCADEIRKRS